MAPALMALRKGLFLCSRNFIRVLGGLRRLHGVGTMAHFWLCYRDSKQRFHVFIVEGRSMIHARKRAALAGLDVGLTCKRTAVGWVSSNKGTPLVVTPVKWKPYRPIADYCLLMSQP